MWNRHIPDAWGQANPFWTPEDPECSIEHLQESEDGDDIVVRGYETAGKKTETVLRLPHADRSVRVVFEPHEIKTMRLGRERGAPVAVNLLEEALR